MGFNPPGFKVAGPIMIQNVLTVGAWFAFFVMIENLGERELAISQVIRGIYIFLMVPIFSLADGTNTLTSNLIGASKAEFILPLARKTTLIGPFGNSHIHASTPIFSGNCSGIIHKRSELHKGHLTHAIPDFGITSVGDRFYDCIQGSLRNRKYKNGFEN